MDPREDLDAFHSIAKFGIARVYDSTKIDFTTKKEPAAYLTRLKSGLYDSYKDESKLTSRLHC